MAKKLALNRRSQYLAVYEHGRAYVDNRLVLKIMPNNLDITRVGYSVSAYIGKATVRNRIKRLIKESVHKLNIESGWDIVFIARKGIIGADFQSISNSVNHLLDRAGILKINVENANSKID